MGGISDLLADLSAGMFDDDPEFLEAVGWDEYDVLHQEGVEHDSRELQVPPAACSIGGGPTAEREAERPLTETASTDTEIPDRDAEKGADDR